ncbi:MAG: acyltransferase [Bacteroidaceae bacterium]|nr:acyltransferase [Bacteroidaceae bacterium]
MNIRPMHNQSDIDVITWLRFPLMIGVVFWHNNLYALIEIWEGTAPQWPHWLIYIFNYLHLIILPAPVPVLFIISGYLFFRNVSTGECVPFADKCKRRINSLLIPYLVWNTIAIIILYIRFNIVAKEGYTLADYLSGYWDFSQRLGNDPADGPLWYMRDLMIISICTPLLYQLLKRNSTAILYFTIITACYVTNTGLYVTGFGGGAFMFFAIGAYIAIHNINLTKIPHPIGIATLVLYIPSQLILNSIGDNAAAFLVTNIIKITALFYLTTLLFNKNILKPTPGLTKICFLLYALHGIIIGPIMKALYTLPHSNNPFILLLIYIATPAIIVVLTAILNHFIQKHAPLLGNILTGNRAR